MEQEDIKKEVEGMISKAVEETAKSTSERLDAIEKNAKETEEILKSVNEKMVQKNATALPIFGDRRSMYREQFKNAIIENAEKFKEMRGSDQSVEFVTKAQTNTEITTTATSRWEFSELEPGSTRPVKRPVFMRDLISVSPISGSYARWTEMEAVDKASPVLEGKEKPQSDIKWVQNNAKVEKIAALVKVSEECLEDIEFAAEDIAAELTEEVLLKEDEQILNGNGASPNFNGLMNYASTLSISTTDPFYQSIGNANLQDVLRVAVAKLQAKNFLPNAVIINPLDAAKLDLTKTAVGDYVSLAMGNTLWQVQVIVNNGIQAGDFLIGDFTRSNYRVRKDVTMLAGREGSDLKHNLFTIIAELRGVHYVKNNHKDAFLKGDFSTLITALTQSAE